jgi:hypothetical protein
MLTLLTLGILPPLLWSRVFFARGEIAGVGWFVAGCGAVWGGLELT